MPSDNIKPDDRFAFEEAYIDTIGSMVERFMAAGLPNAYLETVIGRMLVLRAAACDESLDAVAARVLTTAVAFELCCERDLDIVRQHVRSLREGKGGN